MVHAVIKKIALTSSFSCQKWHSSWNGSVWLCRYLL